jgi:hypothetical protein
MLRPLAVMATALSLGACTTQYAPLYSPAQVATRSVAIDPSAPTGAAARKCISQTGLKQTLACAEVLQGIYSSGYETTSNYQDLASLPVIGGAGAAALILLNGHQNAAKRAGKVGIGVGVFAALRDQFLPSNLPSSFIKGHAALGCVISDGDYFVGENGDKVEANLERQIRVVSAARDDLGKLRFANPTDSKPAAADLLKAARTVTDQALELAATQLQSSEGQWAAFQFANATFRKAVTDVGAWVASRGRERPNTSYNDLVGRLSPPADRSQGGGDEQTESLAFNAERSTGLTTSQLLAALSQGSTALVTQVNILKGATPDYTGRLDHVTKCATDLPAS